MINGPIVIIVGENTYTYHKTAHQNGRSTFIDTMQLSNGNLQSEIVLQQTKLPAEKKYPNRRRESKRLSTNRREYDSTLGTYDGIGFSTVCTIPIGSSVISDAEVADMRERHIALLNDDTLWAQMLRGEG